MGFKRGVAAALALAIVRPAAAETITWEATIEAGPGRARVGGGVRSYSPGADVLVRDGKDARGGRTSDMSLRLDDTFTLSLRATKERRIDGFGLMVERQGDANGFSWEWFDRVEGTTFRRRQGPGRLSIMLRPGLDLEEIRSIEFLDDVSLRYLDDMRKPPGTVTLELVIRKGSVLRVVD